MSSSNNAIESVKFTAIKKLSADIDLSNFDCSHEDVLGLNEFIHNEALKYQQDGMGVTYLFYNHDKIVGYITVAMSSIKVKLTTADIADYPDVSCPALSLGRLAIDNTVRHKGYGDALVNHCIEFAYKARKEIGCRFIVLVTKEGCRADFYRKHGFVLVNKLKLYNNFKMMCFQLPKQI